ncbi:hypothetical protein Lal_00042446 [Lupinus albus]|nr:hypothetical protein Lal_00042446 [Lupinus albus]
MTSSADSKSKNDLLSNVSVKLDRDNYQLWKSLVISIVKGCRPDGNMLGTKDCPEEFIASTDSSKKLNPTFEDWQDHDSQLLGWLMNSITIEMTT